MTHTSSFSAEFLTSFLGTHPKVSFGEGKISKLALSLLEKRDPNFPQGAHIVTILFGAATTGFSYRTFDIWFNKKEHPLDLLPEAYPALAMAALEAGSQIEVADRALSESALRSILEADPITSRAAKLYATMEEAHRASERLELQALQSQWLLWPHLDLEAIMNLSPEDTSEEAETLRQAVKNLPFEIQKEMVAVLHPFQDRFSKTLRGLLPPELLGRSLGGACMFDSIEGPKSFTPESWERLIAKRVASIDQYLDLCSDTTKNPFEWIKIGTSRDAQRMRTFSVSYPDGGVISSWLDANMESFPTEMPELTDIDALFLWVIRKGESITEAEIDMVMPVLSQPYRISLLIRRDNTKLHSFYNASLMRTSKKERSQER